MISAKGLDFAWPNLRTWWLSLNDKMQRKPPKLTLQIESMNRPPLNLDRRELTRRMHFLLVMTVLTLLGTCALGLQFRSRTITRHTPFRTLHVIYTLQKGALHTPNYSHIFGLMNVSASSVAAGPKGDSVMHLITDDADAFRIARGAFPSVRTVQQDYGQLSRRAKSFLDTYRQQSSNAPEMERFCLLRWILMADYFNGLDSSDSRNEYEHILSLDSDVAMFLPGQMMLDQLGFRDWDTFESHEFVSGATVLWARHGLDSFADFIVNFYARSDRLPTLIQSHGEQLDGCKPEWSTIIPCINSTRMWHLSDMNMWRAWSQDKPSLRTFSHPSGAHSDKFDTSTRTCGFIGQPWDDKGTRTFETEDKVFIKDDFGRLLVLGIKPATHTFRSARPLCFMHFQGTAKRLISEFLVFYANKAPSAFTF